jgi:SET domain-containing protein
MISSNQNNTIESAESDYLYKALSQLPNSGNGLFTAINIYKDETISIFKGKILTDSQAKKTVLNGKDQYFINMLDGTIMDSMNTPCFAKYANDVNGTFESQFKNNAKIGLDEENNVCVIAIRTIVSGEEIFCSYGKNYWKKHG